MVDTNSSYDQNARYIIVGASGLIGSRLYDHGIAAGNEVVGTYYLNSATGLLSFDATNDKLLNLVPDLCAKDYVFLLSANIDLDWVYKHPIQSRKLNVKAIGALINEASKREAQVIFVSTEMVFDGIKGGYREEDQPNPITLYARQKLELEEHVRQNCDKWLLIRTGWSVGWTRDQRCPIKNTYESLLTRNAKMAFDNIFSLTDVRDTCSAIWKLVQQRQLGIYHVAATPPVKRTELAGWIKEYSRFGDLMSFEEVPYSSVSLSESRPAQTWLCNEKLIEDIGFKFSPPSRTVQKKVALIDNWSEAESDFPKRQSNSVFFE